MRHIERLQFLFLRVGLLLARKLHPYHIHPQPQRTESHQRRLRKTALQI